MEEDGSSIIFKLKDTGSGINLFPRLFTKFITRSEKGTISGLLRHTEVRYGIEFNDDQRATFGFLLQINTK